MTDLPVCRPTCRLVRPATIPALIRPMGSIDNYPLRLLLSDFIRPIFSVLTRPLAHDQLRDKVGHKCLGAVRTVPLPQLRDGLDRRYRRKPVFSPFRQGILKSIHRSERVQFVHDEPDPSFRIFQKGQDLPDSQSQPAPKERSKVGQLGILIGKEQASFPFTDPSSNRKGSIRFQCRPGP